MNYREALTEALANKELVANYDRLGKHHLGSCLAAIRQGGLNAQIDEATGRLKDEIQKFDVFFNECIWSRIPRDNA